MYEDAGRALFGPGEGIGAGPEAQKRHRALQEVEVCPQEAAWRPEIAPVAVLQITVHPGAVVNEPHVGGAVDVALALGRQAIEQFRLDDVHSREVHLREPRLEARAAP